MHSANNLRHFHTEKKRSQASLWVNICTSYIQIPRHLAIGVFQDKILHFSASYCNCKLDLSHTSLAAWLISSMSKRAIDVSSTDTCLDQAQYACPQFLERQQALCCVQVNIFVRPHLDVQKFPTTQKGCREAAGCAEPSTSV